MNNDKPKVPNGDGQCLPDDIDATLSLPPNAQPSHGHLVGRTVSHYRITSKLGAGGMGVVYEAVDTKLDRTVALKFLPPESTRDPQAKARFVHEAKAASALDHPNVCTIHEVGETDDGQMYLVMARYEGVTLRERIFRGPLPLDEAQDLARQIAAGLAKAHELEIVHRDIKPANVFVTDDGLVKILDFGLAKLEGQTKITRTGTTLGTAGYMSPEQAQGQETDRRSDLWCLGVVLYEMVTGRVPFQGENAQAVIHGIVNAQPEPVTGLRTGVPLELERIIGKCLTKDQRERYQHADDLLADLRHLKRETSQGLTQTMPLGVSRSGRVRRWSLVLGVIVAAVVGGLLVIQFIGGGGDGVVIAGEPALAIVEFRDLTAPDESNDSAGLTELVNIGLIENSPIRVVSPEYLQDLRRRLFGSGRGPIEDDQVLEVARRAGATLVLAGRMGHLGGEQFVTWRLVDTRTGESVEARKVEGLKLTDLVDRIVAGVLPIVTELCGVETAAAQVAVDQITTESQLAYKHYFAGVLFQEKLSLDEARDEWEMAVAADSTFALAHLQLGLLHWSSAFGFRDEEKALAHIEKAELLSTRLGSKDRLRLEAVRYNLQLQVPKAIATYKKILGRWPDDRNALTELMDFYYMHWDFRPAGVIAKKALDLYPDDNFLSRWVYFDSFGATDRPQDALQFSRDYLKRDPNSAEAWVLSHYAWRDSGEPDSALAAIQKAAELNPSYGSLTVFAESAYFAGDLDLAVARQEQYLQENDLSAATRRFYMQSSSAALGLMAYYREGGRHKQMLEIVDEARQFSQGSLSDWAFNKGLALLYAGRPQEALEIADEMPDRYVEAQAPFLALQIRARAVTALGDLEEAHKAVDEIYTAEERHGMKARLLALKFEAEIALIENDPATALAALDKMYVHGVPTGALFFVEYREARARAYHLAGRLEDAVAVHNELLRVYGGHALSHYELGLLYEEMERPVDAKQEFRKFLEMWSKADEGLPQLEMARSRLDVLTAGSR